MPILSFSQKNREPCPKIEMEIEAGASGENVSLPRMNQGSPEKERESGAKREWKRKTHFGGVYR